MKRYSYSAAIVSLLMSTAAIADVENTKAAQSTTASSASSASSAEPVLVSAPASSASSSSAEIASYSDASVKDPGGVKSVSIHNISAQDGQGGHYRIALTQGVSKGTSYDPVTPYRLERYETNLFIEYYRANVSFGLMPTYLKNNTTFYANPNTDSGSSGGLVPFANWLFKPSWLATIQAGYYYENHNWRTQQFTGGPANLSWRQQSNRYFGAAYLTWIGPKKPISGSIRAGTAFQKSNFHQAFDGAGNNVAASNLQRGSVSLSGRLKYSPEDVWELFFQTQVDYSYRVTRRNMEYRMGGGRQSIRLAVGPGVNYNPSPTTEVGVSFLHVQGWGYYRENQMTLRLRILV